jgi:hypothetical protein
MLDLIPRIVDGALTRRDGGLLTSATGLPIRLFDQVAVEGIDVAQVDPQAIGPAVEMQRARGLPFMINLRRQIMGFPIH